MPLIEVGIAAIRLIIELLGKCGAAFAPGPLWIWVKFKLKKSPSSGSL